MPATVTLTGFKEFEDKLRNLTPELLEEFDGECKAATEQWVDLAKNDAPVDQGFLRSLISNKRISQGNWEVISGAEYSAYLEWGTRLKVSVPAELSAYASEFRGKKGGDAKKMIFAWCARVGIPQDKWFAVFISIMVKGINPHPYFFIQSDLVQKEFIEHIENILKTEH